MPHPEWILVSWAVFAVALALKVMKFGKALKRHLIAPPSSTDQFRQILERIWAQEAQKETK
jgi:ABC-type sugar transport system substrate-binding protein